MKLTTQNKKTKEEHQQMDKKQKQAAKNKERNM